jgi:hypothetical protein
MDEKKAYKRRNIEPWTVVMFRYYTKSVMNSYFFYNKKHNFRF